MMMDGDGGDGGDGGSGGGDSDGLKEWRNGNE